MTSSDNGTSCFFNCSNASQKLITASRTRIETIIKSSIRRGDGFHEKLTDSQSITKAVYPLIHLNTISKDMNDSPRMKIFQ